MFFPVLPQRPKRAFLFADLRLHLLVQFAREILVAVADGFDRSTA